MINEIFSYCHFPHLVNFGIANNDYVHRIFNLLKIAHQLGQKYQIKARGLFGKLDENVLSELFEG